MNIPLTVALHVGVVLLVVVVLRFAGQGTRPLPLLAAIGVLVAYWIVSPLGFRLQEAMPVSAHWHWNWFGKVLTLTVAVAIWRVSGLSRDAIGLTFRQRQGSRLPALLCVALICVFAWTNEALKADGVSLSTERLFFQAIMPGLDEELVFRGILLAFFTRAFGSADEMSGNPFLAAGAVVTFLFAAGHGLYVVGGGLQVDWRPLFEAGTIGAGLLYLRARTGSLAMPVIAHNLSNFGDSFF